MRTVPIHRSDWPLIRQDLISKIQGRCVAVFGPIPDSPCRIWTGATVGDLTKYGSIRFNNLSWVASRLLFSCYYELQLEQKQQVLHSCDNGLCCEISHLSLGDARQNQIDVITRGRNPKREKLSEQNIKNIRSKVSQGSKCIDVAREYRVAPGTISAIITGKTWRHVK